ncbi:MAG: hypothetical protein JWN86_488 [Planctomycetota bacterium]|nr:hypothetical protein [Planctomycetota bacterium]
MQGAKTRLVSTVKCDLIAFDRDDTPVLLVEVKGVTPAPASIQQLVSYMLLLDPLMPFGMLADPMDLRLFRVGMDGSATDVASFKTDDVLRHYSPEYFPASISADYLTALLNAWLADLATHWNSPVPPMSGEMARLGLLPLLEGGTIEREVDLASHRLR